MKPNGTLFHAAFHFSFPFPGLISPLYLKIKLKIKKHNSKSELNPKINIAIQKPIQIQKPRSEAHAETFREPNRTCTRRNRRFQKPSPDKHALNNSQIEDPSSPDHTESPRPGAIL
jgi:hypothetical protein